jgi:hypothetical protein
MGTDLDLRKLHVNDTRGILIKLGRSVIIIFKKNTNLIKYHN